MDAASLSNKLLNETTSEISGNCYYRAVLFAWLEHCFAQGLQRPLQALLEKLGNGKEETSDANLLYVG